MSPTNTFAALMAALTTRLRAPAVIEIGSQTQVGPTVPNAPKPVVPTHLPDAPYLFGTAVSLLPGFAIVSQHRNGRLSIQRPCPKTSLS